MRRIGRHLFTILAAASLLLCVGVCVLWVRSYRVGDACAYVSGGIRAAVYSVCTARGGVLLSYTAASFGEESLSRPFWRYVSGPVDGWDAPVTRTWAGFGWNGSYYGNTTVARVPCWFLIALLASPTGLLIRRRLRRVGASDVCLVCGYDLRAHAAGERCPECGTDVRR